MPTHISDSAIYQNAWGTPELRALFNDTSRTAGWIEVMVVLAQTQAEFGLIPKHTAEQLTKACGGLDLNNAFFREVREDFESTNHSLLGLIRAVQRRCPGNSGEWLCYGATVQDITDTHTVRVLVKIRDIFSDKLAEISTLLRELAGRYRDTPMCGRTHGQAGLPITFGFKVAGWLDEIERHRQRLQEIKPRLGVGQLAGGVGSLSSLGPNAFEVQERFFERLGLASPEISWTASRDRFAEWLNLMSFITSTGDRIGREVYNLQRPEIAELSEGFMSGTVGSITMPQKRNPELSEHLGTLARLVRHHTAHMNENLVQEHERDGRSWKGEWVILPEACLSTGKALQLLHDLIGNLVVHPVQMEHNLLATEGLVHAESVMLALAPKLGKQTAHAHVYSIAMNAVEHGRPLKEALLSNSEVTKHISKDQLTALFDLRNSTGRCAEMVDKVLAHVGSDCSPAFRK